MGHGARMGEGGDFGRLGADAQECVAARDNSGPGLGRLVGASPGMRQVYDLIRRVGAREVTVLITGESGTGKELVARTIHEQSRRAGQPFLAINCGAMSP